MGSNPTPPATETLTQTLQIFQGLDTVSVDLTPNEARVAELVAAGGTNREVADALFVSVHTVEANLKRIYRKLGIRSRTELASALRPPPSGS